MKSKQPQITTDMLLDWKKEKEVEFCGQFGKGIHKSLKCTLHGTYKVYDHNSLIREFTQPQAAINCYNEL